MKDSGDSLNQGSEENSAEYDDMLYINSVDRVVHENYNGHVRLRI